MRRIPRLTFAGICVYLALAAGCKDDPARKGPQLAAEPLAICPTGQKRCGGLCVDPHPSIGCGLSDCEPCPEADRGSVQCEAGACVGATSAAIDDIPATEGCLDPFDPATELPPSPETALECPDPRSLPGEQPVRPCCFYRCFRGHHYYFCSPPTGNSSGWDRARNRCRASGMKLVQVDDHRENDFVALTGLKHGLHPIWTGLNNLGDAAVWRWLTVADDAGPVLYRDNTLVNESAFSAFRPVDVAVLSMCVECAMLIGTNNSEWSRYGWDVGAYTYVCESE